MISNIVKKALLPSIFLLLSACAYNNSGARKSAPPLSGTFFPYHTALGAGRGIIFRIPIPANRMEYYSADSFYLNGKSQNFSTRTIRDTLYLESSYFVSAPSRTVGEPVGEYKNLTQIVSNDSILAKRQFYPSWIIFSGKKGTTRIDISDYKEIFTQTKL
ncbi:MAG: hypothetical protein EBZ95_07355 [Chitinophagia bacterium]|jgi:hypothetical protein|nr:hypothetical protein [Chitinophagia bacterium]